MNINLPSVPSTAVSKGKLRKICALAALVVLAVAEYPAMAYALPTYRLEFEGPPEDYISQGQHVVLTQHDVGLSTFVGDLTGDNLIDSVQFNSPGVGELFFLLFFDTDKIPGNLVPGFYPSAQRSPFAEPGHSGFWLAWDHRGCNRISGSYTISESVFGPSGPTKFSAQFEQSCEEFFPPLTGTFEFTNQSVPEPASLVLLGMALAMLACPALRRCRSSVRRRAGVRR